MADTPEDTPTPAADEAGSRQQVEATPEEGVAPSNAEPRPSADPDTPASGPVDPITGRPSGSLAEEVPGSGVSEELDELVAGLRRERDEYLDLARRAKADFENYRKRAAQQTTDAGKRAKADLARELLPAIDSLERALAGADTRGDGLAKGVSLVRDELVATLARAGVEVYDPAGERFDPTWHEALSTVPASEGVESGIVIETVDRGYRLDGQVLRPARVVVSE